jgi:hypothetical protein
MQNNDELSGPVIIGGVGGSGTRVVAEIIDHLGYYIGKDLDPARDNLWFLLLFKRPRWYRRAQHDRPNIFTGLSLFSNAMLHRKFPSWSQLIFLIRAVLEISIFGHNHKGDGRGAWPFVRAWNMVAMKPQKLSKYTGWGWKEPNTHLYLDCLAEYFKDFKYIHTLRHGLDMAFSKNQQQLYNWGPFFDVKTPDTKTEEPAASLKYWVKSNRRVLEIGKKLGDAKFLLVNFDKLCLSPKTEIQKIVSFLNIKHSFENLEMAFNIPKRPKSLGRYRAHNLGQFDPADLYNLKELGFSLLDYF